MSIFVLLIPLTTISTLFPYTTLFRSENMYVELADHGQAAQERALAGLYELAERNDLPVVVANDSHYVADDEQDVHEAHMALGQKRTVTSENRYRFAGGGQYFRNGAQMRARRPDAPRWPTGCHD